MKSINSYDFRGKKAIIRVDFNVPLSDDFSITDDTRIMAALPTINKVIEKGGAVILMSHLGRPKSGPEDKYSLKHIVNYLSQKLGLSVKFATDCVGKDAKELSAGLQMGEVLILENLRFHDEETAGDPSFAKALAELADVYINDAFGTAHRAHASTAIIADYFGENKMFGYVIENELEAVKNILEKNQRPFTAIMGGAKISDKILLIEKMLDKVDQLLIGGGMSYTFFKAMGGNIGSSLVEEDKLDLAKAIMDKAKAKGVKLLLPADSVIADAFSETAQTAHAENKDIPNGWMGLDIGPDAMLSFSEAIANSKTIMWNGPMGVFEMKPFQAGTKAVADAIVEATQAGAYSLIGGGDSAAAINKFGLGDKVSYISTGGGALLEYLEGKELPGIKAIQD